MYTPHTCTSVFPQLWALFLFSLLNLFSPVELGIEPGSSTYLVSVLSWRYSGWKITHSIIQSFLCFTANGIKSGISTFGIIGLHFGFVFPNNIYTNGFILVLKSFCYISPELHSFMFPVTVSVKMITVTLVLQLLPDRDRLTRNRECHCVWRLKMRLTVWQEVRDHKSQLQSWKVAKTQEHTDSFVTSRQHLLRTFSFPGIECMWRPQTGGVRGLSFPSPDSPPVPHEVWYWKRGLSAEF